MAVKNNLFIRIKFDVVNFSLSRRTYKRFRVICGPAACNRAL